eukprot:472137-Prorocentrum_minimum.AAC.1
MKQDNWSRLAYQRMVKLRIECSPRRRGLAGGARRIDPRLAFFGWRCTAGVEGPGRNSYCIDSRAPSKSMWRFPSRNSGVFHCDCPNCRATW